MTACPPRVGPVPPRARAVVVAGVAVALATAAPVSPADPSARPGGREPLAFAGLAWGAAPGEVSARLAKLGFRRAPERDAAAGGPAWRGRWRGEPATCTPEVRPAAGLVAVTLRFEPGTVGDALRLYAGLGAYMERRHGPELVEVGPGRPIGYVHYGLRWRLAPPGDPAGARLWTGPDGAAAALQLDGERVVWLRWESPGWAPETAPDYGIEPRR